MGTYISFEVMIRVNFVFFVHIPPDLRVDIISFFPTLIQTRFLLVIICNHVNQTRQVSIHNYKSNRYSN
jgi:hypothetical protein